MFQLLFFYFSCWAAFCRLQIDANVISFQQHFFLFQSPFCYSSCLARFWHLYTSLMLLLAFNNVYACFSSSFSTLAVWQHFAIGGCQPNANELVKICRFQLLFSTLAVERHFIPSGRCQPNANISFHQPFFSLLAFILSLYNFQPFAFIYLFYFFAMFYQV